ncbi:MAG: hypothetical protein H0T42_15255 [Deltaproteobacteria bacterium]|nr:hypothetical protein [Deltaproteobacteria bacterium]
MDPRIPTRFDGPIVDVPIPVDAASDAPIDARVIVPVSGTGCTPAAPVTTFPGGVACADWMGTLTIDRATVTESGGALSISPSAGAAGAFGQCGRAIVFDAPGVFVEISDVVDGVSTFTSVGLSAFGPIVYSMSVRNDILVFQHTLGTITTIPYDPVAMRWWRMRPITGGVLYETAPEASAWTVRATSSVPSSEMTDVQLFGGVGAAEPAPGTARFETVNVCP